MPYKLTNQGSHPALRRDLLKFEVSKNQDSKTQLFF